LVSGALLEFVLMDFNETCTDESLRDREDLSILSMVGQRSRSFLLFKNFARRGTLSTALVI